MEHENYPERIILNPDVMAGKPCIRGSRLTVAYILRLLGQGATPEEIMSEYPGLEIEDIQACLRFAEKTLENSTFLPLAVEA
jgi:uncharacterized protein (DUF433 family)